MKKLLCVIALFSLAACARVQAPAPVADTREADLKALHELEQSSMKAWTEKNLDGILAQYAPDATFYVAGAPPAKGAAEMRAGLGPMLQDPALALQFGATVTEVSGDLAYQRGNYDLTVTNPATKKPVHDKGSFVTVFKKQADGSWKVVEDMNVSGPPVN